MTVYGQTSNALAYSSNTVTFTNSRSAADAGNNFFFEGPDSIDKPRAEEAVRLLLELNDSVDGRPDVAVSS